MQIDAKHLFIQRNKYEETLVKYKNIINNQHKIIKELMQNLEDMDQAYVYDYQLAAIMEGNYDQLSELDFNLKSFSNMLHDDPDLDSQFKADLLHSLIHDSVYDKYR